MLGFKLIIPDNFKAFLYYFSSPESTALSGNSGEWLTGEILVDCPIDNYIRIILSKIDDFTLKPQDIPEDIVFINYKITDTTLTLSGKIPDSKEVGDLFNKTIQYRGTLNSSNDINTNLQSGIYHLIMNDLPANSPTIYNGIFIRLIQLDDTNNNASLDLVIDENNIIWWRYRKYNGDFTNWQQLITENNLNDVIESIDHIANKKLFYKTAILNYEQGGLRTNGGIIKNTTAITSGYHKFGSGGYIYYEIPEGYKIDIFLYREMDYTSVLTSYHDLIGQGHISSQMADYYKISVKKSSEENITPSELPENLIIKDAFPFANKIINTEIVYDLNTYDQQKGLIRSDNLWHIVQSASSALSILIPIDEIDYITITANKDNPSIIAFLIDDNLIDARLPNYANNTYGRYTIESNTTTTFVVPEDSKYVYVYAGNTSVNYLPDTITGIDLAIDCETFVLLQKAYENTTNKHPGLIRDTPKNQGVRNAYKKAMQATSIKYQTKGTIALSNARTTADLPADTYQGINYTGTNDKAHYVYWNVSELSYMTAIHNPYSAMYTEDVSYDSSTSAYGITYYGSNAGAPIGTVCAPTTMWCLGIPIKWENHAIPYLESIGVLELIEDQSATGVELMDIIWYQGHTALVSDIYRDSRGEPKILYVMESKSPFAVETMYTAESFNERLLQIHNGLPTRLYRYKDLYKNLNYTPSKFIAVDQEEEVEEYKYNEDICTWMGDYAVFRVGEPIIINIISNEYTKMVVTKDNEILYTIPINLSSIHAINLTSYNLIAGNYTAYLFNDGDLKTDPTYFKIVDLPISVIKNESELSVSFDSTKAPRYIQVMNRAGGAYCVVELNDDVKETGNITFNAEELHNKQGSTVTDGSYVAVIYEVIDPANYKLLRASEFVYIGDGKDDNISNDDDNPPN